MEIWKDIEEFNNLYQISSYGRVRGKGRVLCNGKYLKPKYLKPAFNNTGYLQIRITIDNERRIYLVHRLVGKYFIPNTDNKLTINHKDGNKSNNHVSNLEWLSQQDNCIHAALSGLTRVGSKSHRSRLTEEEVSDIVRFSKYLNIPQISKIMNVEYTIIHKILNGYAWNQITGLPRKRYHLKEAS